MIVVLSIMGGFEEDLKGKMFRADPHITLSSAQGLLLKESGYIYDRFASDLIRPYIKAVSPFIQGELMLQSKQRLTATDIKGVDVHKWAKESDIPDLLVEGSVLEIAEKEGVPGIILGDRLAMDLLIGLGDIVNLLSPTEYEGPMGLAPKSKGFVVVGIFSSGLYQIDATQSFVSMAALRGFLRIPAQQLTGIDIRVSHPYNSNLIVERIKTGWDQAARVEIRDWQEKNSALFSALRMEKLAMAFILLITVLVASFSIVSTLYLMVMEKAASIAVLKAIGASKNAVARIFMVKGLFIGVGGTVIGFVVSMIFLYLLDRYKFIPLPPGVYHLDKLPVKFLFVEYGVICISSILLSLIATLFPSKRAAGLDPVMGFRYE